MKKIILFIQAPADIQYALTIYKRNKSNTEISIFCINVEGIYNFIKNLNLNLKQLIFIPYDLTLKIKNPISIYSSKKKLEQIYENYFTNIENTKVFFFSHFFDYITFYCLSKLANRNEIKFINHYDDQISKNYYRDRFSFKTSFLKITYYYLTTIWFRLFRFNNKRILEFPFEKYGIEEVKDNILDENIHKEYSYRVNDNEKKRILFLEMDYKKIDFFDDYKKTTISIVEQSDKKGYKIYLKPHPRLGYSKFLDQYIHKVINKDVPAEFIEIENFDYILGISSSAIAYFSKENNKKVYSLLELYQYNDVSIKQRAKEYLKDLCSHINYLNSIEEIGK
jgi:hypothetical protein